jgi:hypothetical protein
MPGRGRVILWKSCGKRGWRTGLRADSAVWKRRWQEARTTKDTKVHEGRHFLPRAWRLLRMTSDLGE